MQRAYDLHEETVKIAKLKLGVLTSVSAFRPDAGYRQVAKWS
jgi:hypothetical protein